MVKRIAISSALLAVAATLSCAMIAGLDGDFHGKGGSGGGSTIATGATGGAGGAGGTATTGSGGSGGAVQACVLDVPPQPPANPDDGTIDFVTALHKIDLDEEKPDVKVGLDLDGACSCLNDAPGSCTTTANAVCDGPGGIDNAVGLLFSTVYNISFMLITSGALSKAANDGNWTILMRVRGYNGTPNDPKVEAMLYSTQGVAAGMPAPKWDGTDAWPVDDTSISDPMNIDSAIVVSTEAYVRDGVLVARLPSERVKITSPLFSITLDLVDVVVRANLEATQTGAWQLRKGMVGGKWPVSNVFPGMASVRYNGSTKLCKDDKNYDAVKTAICNNVDLRLDGAPGPCDALSFGGGFEADPVKLGSVVPAAGPPMDACSAAQDPTTDKCN